MWYIRLKILSRKLFNNMTNSIHLDGSSLSIEQVIRVAYERTPVELTPAAVKKVERAAQAVQDLLARGEIAYGVTTGFGAFKDRIISADQVETLQRNIIVSHAVGVGDLFDIPTTRAIMLIRANTLAHGHSGIRHATLHLLLEMLNRGVHPCIPEKGSLGASGDLAPLAHMALVMIGEGEAEYKGEVVGGREALHRAGLEPVTLAAKEGLALTNGTSVMCALGTLAVHRAERLSRTADVAGCLSLEALHGTTLAFDERIHAVRPTRARSNARLPAQAAGWQPVHPRARPYQRAGCLYFALHPAGPWRGAGCDCLCALGDGDRTERRNRQSAHLHR
jgi:histidine ammonia-lyase